MARLGVYLNFSGNAEETMNFYKSVFGGEFQNIMRFKDMPMKGMKTAKSEENKLMNISLPVGKEDVLMASDALESHGQKVIQGNNVHLSLIPESKSETERLFKALSAGGKVEMPLADQPWNAYYGSFKDKFGINWMVNYTYQKGEMKSEPVGARAGKTR